MQDRWLLIFGLIGGATLGIGALAAPSAISKMAALFEPATAEDGSIELRADLAAARPEAELNSDQLSEIFEGLAALANGRYPEAAELLGKYAMRGDKAAQSAIGSMFYFGLGLPLDRSEGYRWFGLAAAQGDAAGTQMLAAAADGSLVWEHKSEPRVTYSGSVQPGPQFDAESSPVTRSYEGVPYGSGSPYAGPNSGYSSSPPMGATRSVQKAYGPEPASRQHTLPQVASPQIGSGSPVILNPAGPGTYSDGRGDIYTQAGPQGVINTRTGEFSPTN